MAEDWDLYAVVRGCNSTPETPPASTNTTTSEDPLSSLATLTFKEENYPFSFSNLVQPRTHGLQEPQRLFIPFNPTTSTTTTTTTSGSGSGGSGFGINPNSPFSDSAGSIEQEQQKHQQNQLKVGHKQELQVPQSSSATTLPNTQVSTPRSRKRKIQQKRMVCHVTAENLSADLWAWRKYGQKPIKGSPYPRNYYRCSSSKGCAARKQVERSISEPDMFIVTYTGDHLHPPPTHRNSLAGSTRNKISTTHIPQTEGSGSPRNPANPTMALTSDPLDVEDAAEETVSTNEYPSPDPDLEIQVASDDDILIPNIASMAEDSFMGLHQLGGGGGSVNSSGGSSPASQPGFAPAFNNDNLSDNTRPNPG